MLNVLKIPVPTTENVAEVQAAYEKLLKGHRANPAPSADEREDRLERLEKVLIAHREEFVSAADADFSGRARHETLIADVVLTLESVRDARRNVRGWMKPRRVRPHSLFTGSRAYIEPVPKGVVAILAPWNYPVNLALSPLAAALAAGNRALVKPSELTPRVSQVIAEAIRGSFTAEEVAVIEGGPGVAQAVTRLPLGHLLFTGSTPVGKIVARATAEHLVPVTLELGGKSPVLIHESYPMARAAERIAAGKLFNAGQTCIAPDYALVPEGKEDVFAQAFTKAAKEIWPQGPATSMATEKGLERMRALLDDAKSKGARCEEVPLPPGPGRAMSPVLVFNVREDMRIMQEEIFGPLLPVVGYRSQDDALERIAARPNPLAFYVFDADVKRAQELVKRVSCGDACINETLAHFAQEGLPFGGVGGSGMGQYHGRYGFETFSHLKGVLVAGAFSPSRALFTPNVMKHIDKVMGLLVSKAGRLIR